jgi:catechol 2,3-dioxygenase-like lactoylglutathione lyase family enzyme
MHKSQLAGFIIDCQDGDIDAAADFWGAALGLRRRASTAPEDDAYRLLETGANGLHIEVQRVTHPSRVHLDIETDDIEAEVARLEGLGARRVQQVRTWWVLEAPTGHRFCVVRRARGKFDEEANEWP